MVSLQKVNEMSNIPKARKMIRHRLKGMIKESKMRVRFGNKQQLEEILHLFDLIEREVEQGKPWEEKAK